MANKKISELTAASVAAGTNEIPINESGTTKKITITKILTDINQACFHQFYNIGTVSGGTLTIDWATNGNKQYFTQSANITVLTWTPPTGPCNLILKRIHRNSRGARASSRL